MPPERPILTRYRPSRPTRRAAVAVAFGPLLAVQAALGYYFAAREQADWILLSACALAGVACVARLAAALRPARAE